MALAPDDAALPGVRQLAEKRFGYRHRVKRAVVRDATGHH